MPRPTTVLLADDDKLTLKAQVGPGAAFVEFHAYYDGSLQEGDYVTHGQYVGTIAPAYEAAAGSNARRAISSCRGSTRTVLQESHRCRAA